MFSFKRFSEQFKIILMQNAQKQGMFLAVLSLVFIYSHFVMFQKGGGSLPLDFMFWGFVITVFTIVNSTNVFSALLRTDSGIHYYMTPASIGEKFAAAWLYSSIFTIAVLFTGHRIGSLSLHDCRECHHRLKSTLQLSRQRCHEGRILSFDDHSIHLFSGSCGLQEKPVWQDIAFHHLFWIYRRHYRCCRNQLVSSWCRCNGRQQFHKLQLEHKYQQY